MVGQPYQLDVLRWLQCRAPKETSALDALAEQVRGLRVVDDSTPPTAEDVERLQLYARRDAGPVEDWYQLLRETQGNCKLILEAGVIEDSKGFPFDSLFAEWGYIIDLDERRFEVYQGFQTHRHDSGRFARSEPDGAGYYPVALAASWLLTELPTDEGFLATLKEEDDD